MWPGTSELERKSRCLTSVAYESLRAEKEVFFTSIQTMMSQEEVLLIHDSIHWKEAGYIQASYKLGRNLPVSLSVTGSVASKTLLKQSLLSKNSSSYFVYISLQKLSSYLVYISFQLLPSYSHLNFQNRWAVQY
jgi:hypothetical protein